MSLHGNGAEILSSRPAPTPTTPLLATSSVPPSHLFPITKWKPRSRRTKAYILWERDLKLLAAAFGLTTEQLMDSVPTLESYQQMMQSRPAVTRVKAADIAAAFNAHLKRWLQINCAIYWHVLPSLDIAGPHMLSDMRALEDRLFTVITGPDGKGRTMADGRGLIAWARQHCDRSDKVSQKALGRDIAKLELAIGASRAQLNLHAERLFQMWSLIGSNNPADRNDLADYYD